MTSMRIHHAICLTIAVLSFTACSSSSADQTAAVSLAAGAGATNGTQAGGQRGSFQLGGGPAIQVAADFVRRCKNASADSLECEVFRSLLVGELTRALQKGEAARDKRAVEPALAALALTEEPEVVIAASRILGHFPDTPDLVAKTMPLMLDSPYLEVQRMAANVLGATADANARALGRLWTESHGGFYAESPYDEYPDFPDHYAAIGFPNYPGAEWFSPADTDRSVGWSTTDDAAAVARWFGETLRADVLDFERWNQLSTQQAVAIVQSFVDPARTKRMQELMELIMKGKGDQAANAEYQKLAQEMDANRPQMDSALKNLVLDASLPGSFAREAKWIIAQKKGERISKLVVVFPIAGLKRTGIRLIWDLSDYPSAWPKPKG